ncbi:hypothetical protein GEV33_003153 [Tenebrio molitor]|uniref:Uncharacterized protein n=1 Tax=Tenebrio molitor TaxID=7067 RepID=A0A8J6LHZ8_TENMO|nr:hypothetical protein GEV33_003153 [Tenebrio molitor]
MQLNFLIVCFIRRLPRTSSSRIPCKSSPLEHNKTSNKPSVFAGTVDHLLPELIALRSKGINQEGTGPADEAYSCLIVAALLPINPPVYLLTDLAADAGINAPK